MRMSVLFTAGFILLILISVSYATCVDPIDAYHKCTAACPNAVADSEGAAKCDNVCIGNHMKDNDAYLACQRQEREQKALEAKHAEAKRLEAEKLAKEAELKNSTHVTTVEGDVMVYRKDGSQQKVTKDFILKDGDKIKTGKHSYVFITMPNGHMVKMGCETSFKYSSEEILTQDKEILKRYYFDILFGKLRKMYAEKLMENPEFRRTHYVIGPMYEIRMITPPAVCAARSTDFIVDYDNSTNTTTVYLYEGAVEVNDTKGNNYTMSPGETFIVDTYGFKERMTLSQANWDGLVNSIDTGEDFTPGPETTLQTYAAAPAENETQTETTVPVEQKSRMTIYLIMIAAVVAIIIVSVIIARLKKDKK